VSAAPILLILLYSFLSPTIGAGSGTIAVRDGDGPACEESGQEYLVIRVSSDEMITALHNYLANRPQTIVFTDKHFKRNAGEWEGVKAEWMEIAFTGNIKFCGKSERERYFSAILDALRKPNPDLRLFVLAILHSRNDFLLKQIEERITESQDDKNYVANLERARRHILHQRKTPEPHPTTTTVKKVEKSWRKK
jgi:hypothetical protein